MQERHDACTPLEFMDSPETTWEEEAQAVLQDVQQHVKEISISTELVSSKRQIFLNLTTLEEQQYTVELSAAGFRIVGRSHNTQSESGIIYETPYALLSAISPGYSGNFAESLICRLNELNKE
ncbi:Protein of unknown function (DUF727) [Nesidiocoris tenuis]|uniref:GSKIP domain-containing protein n=1 Tax=Nesidiocoris tenuis TaxID=355587 RepID=A0ABN7BCW8_9HEMI|nr:Protein of unknown function (DUF727) [Nesidiocoris tenuis]